MIRLLISLLIIALPTNALAAVSCCADMKPAAQTEKPCHEMPDTKKDAGQTCTDCSFCIMGAVLLPDSYETDVPLLSVEKTESGPFLIRILFHPPFKPPKSV